MNNTFGVTKKLLFQYLDTLGFGGSTKNANGNYSGGEEIFYIQPRAGQVYRISQLIVLVEDTEDFRANKYGNLSELSNGIVVRQQNDDITMLDITAGLPVKSIADWTGIASGDTLLDINPTVGTDNESFAAVINFLATGQPLRLVGSNNERLEVVLNDNLTGLTNHTFFVQGYQEEAT